MQRVGWHRRKEATYCKSYRNPRQDTVDAGLTITAKFNAKKADDIRSTFMPVTMPNIHRF